MIFHRAALREFVSTAAALFVGLSFIMVTVVLIRFLSQAAGGQVPADAVLALIGFTSLNWMPISLSLSVFVAILLTLARNWRESEMVVWFASGQPLTAWIAPVLRFAIPIVAVIGALSLYVSPWAQMKAAEYRKDLEAREEVSRVTPGVFREIASAQRVFYVESIAGDEGRVRNVFVVTAREGKHNVTVAASGRIELAKNGDRFMVLENGRRYEGEPGRQDFRVMNFASYALRIEPKEVERVALSTKTATSTQLLTLPTQQNLGELLRRVSLPVSALILALLAIPLSYVNPRGGRAYSLVFAILLFTVYINLIGIGQAWVGQGRAGFAAAMASIHLPMLALFCVLMWRRTNPNRNWLGWLRRRGSA
ncbi:MAG: LPS export ABC transporter permease LptF [Moraxellaceae bacterium]|nr:LPS export ABC transporter permease LptF [Moraxellaceae bacterium]